MKPYVTKLAALFFFFNTTLYAYNHDESKWIVVTTINYPTQAIKKLSSLPGWNVVIVADKKTPSGWQTPGCIFLSVEDQLSLNYQIIPLLPWNHYCRKNIGYLYAIEHGATIIFDTDDDNTPVTDSIDYLPSLAPVLVAETTEACINPHLFFGQPTTWPRGYPLEKILVNNNPLLTSKLVRPLIQQGLVNEDPDVDAIFRLTQGKLLTFTSHQPIGLSRGTMSPFNTQNTIFHYDAFWGLMIPIATSFRICDIWRGYVTQRLLWEIQGTLCFLPAAVVQKRNEHNLLNDFIQEIDLYTKAGALINFLREWRSPQPSLPLKMNDLMKALIQKNFYKENELAFTQAWLQDLQNIGYKFPPLA
jgi:hypothetical protein